MPGIQRLLQGLPFHFPVVRRSSSNETPTVKVKTAPTNGITPVNTTVVTSKAPAHITHEIATNGAATPPPYSRPENIKPEPPASPFSKYEIDEAEEDQRLRRAEQDVLLVHGPGQEYALQRGFSIPSPTADDELLVKVITIGLNPIDWKGPKYNFGLPTLPWINGRDLTGVVIKTPKRSVARRVRRGDVVICPSTDYRDIRKAAFQEYVIASEHTSARVPTSLGVERSAGVGVAFVAAALALGVCLGVEFLDSGDLSGSSSTWTSPTGGKGRGLDLFRMLREEVNADQIPEDVRDECLQLVRGDERPRPGDWIAIWGASSATGLLTAQLSKKHAGLRTLCIVDSARHANMLLDSGCADLIVDRLPSAERAAGVVKGVTGGTLRYAVDTVGVESAGLLQGCLAVSADDATNVVPRGRDANGTLGEEHHDPASSRKRSHIVGLTGLPKDAPPGVVQHKVPIKAFHAVPAVGEALMGWLERLLVDGGIEVPRTEVAGGGLGELGGSDKGSIGASDGGSNGSGGLENGGNGGSGLGSVNEALERVRGGTGGSRVVVPVLPGVA